MLLQRAVLAGWTHYFYFVLLVIVITSGYKSNSSPSVAVFPGCGMGQGMVTLAGGHSQRGRTGNVGWPHTARHTIVPVARSLLRRFFLFSHSHHFIFRGRSLSSCFTPSRIEHESCNDVDHFPMRFFFDVVDVVGGCEGELVLVTARRGGFLRDVHE